jgi:hypothetical protein
MKLPRLHLRLSPRHRSTSKKQLRHARYASSPSSSALRWMVPVLICFLFRFAFFVVGVLTLGCKELLGSYTFLCIWGTNFIHDPPSCSHSINFSPKYNVTKLSVTHNTPLAHSISVSLTTSVKRDCKLATRSRIPFSDREMPRGRIHVLSRTCNTPLRRVFRYCKLEKRFHFPVYFLLSAFWWLFRSFPPPL